MLKPQGENRSYIKLSRENAQNICKNATGHRAEPCDSVSPVALAVGAEVVRIGSCADAAVTRRLNLVVETVFLGISDGVISAFEGKPDLSASVGAAGPTHERAGLGRRARNWISEKSDGEVINIAHGKTISIGTLAEMIIEITDSQSSVVYKSPREGDIVHSAADLTKARKLIGYESKTSMERGLSMTIDYFKQSVSNA